MKKGQLWVSAVLYIALGVVAITLVLSAGIPLINKMKDRSTVLEAKELMSALDTAINDVRREGSGSKRALSPVIIKGGSLLIDPKGEKLRWKLKTSAVMVEPCIITPEYYQDDSGVLDFCKAQDLILKEGNLDYFETTTLVKKEYYVRVELDYKNKINIISTNSNPLTGKYSFSIENVGASSKTIEGTEIIVTDVRITVT